MPIPIACPKCGRKYQVRDELAGKLAKCSCGQTFAVPKPAEPMRPLEDKNLLTTPADPFAGLSEAVAGEGSALAPLPRRHKRRFKAKAISPGFILFVLGGLVIVAAIGALAFLVAKLVAAAGPRWKTPEEVFAAYRQAEEECDWRMYFETQCPAWQDKLMAGVAVTLALDTPDCPALGELCERYGIMPADTEELRGDSAKIRGLQDELTKTVEQMSISKRARLFAEYVEILTDDSRLPDRVPRAVYHAINEWKAKTSYGMAPHLTNLKIDGDVASATVDTYARDNPNQSTGGTYVGFVRVDGEWRIGPVP